MFDFSNRGYRDDEELYVDDQCCDNCAAYDCPMALTDDEKRNRIVRKRRKEDAIERDGEINWCIYWKQRGRHGSKQGGRSKNR